MEQHRTDRIQLVLWAGAIGFLVMAFRSVMASSWGIAEEGPYVDPGRVAWVAAGLATGAIALAYSLWRHFSRPRPQ